MTASARKKRKTISKLVTRTARKKPSKMQQGYTRFVRLPAKEVPHAEECLLSCLKYGGGDMDETLARGVTVVPVPVGKAPEGGECFPRAWKRRGEALRGDAVWCVPARCDLSRRMLFFHGGAYTGSSPQDPAYLAFATQLARASGLAVLSIDYRLAPEHRCPAAVEDAVAALKWLASYGPPARGSPAGSTSTKMQAKEIFLSGDSAGGGLAFACALTAPTALRPVLRGVVGISAWTDLTASSTTYDSRLWDPKTKTGDPFDDRPGSLNMAETYTGSGARRFPPRDPRASPMFASPSQLRELPPSLFIVGDYELGLGDSVEMREKLVAAGHMDASISVYDRMFHCHVLYAEGKATGQVLKSGARGVKEIASWISSKSLGN